MSIGVGLSPYVFHGIARTAQESADIDATIQWLNSGQSQIDEHGQRVTAPPNGAGSWSAYFSQQAKPGEPSLEDIIMQRLN